MDEFGAPNSKKNPLSSTERPFLLGNLPRRTTSQGISAASLAPRGLVNTQLQLAEKTIKAFRANVAKESYSHMTSRGDLWKEQGLQKGRDSIIKLSNENINRLRKELLPLKNSEKMLLRKILESDFFATHATNANIVKDGHASLFSSKMLEEKNIKFERGHAAVVCKEEGGAETDIDRFGHDDFVFFALEAGSLPKKATSRFGSTVHRFNFDQASFDEAWMSLGDMGNELHVPDLSKYVNVSKIDAQALQKRKVAGLANVYYGPQMLHGLALSIIRDCRKLSSAEDQNRILESQTEPEINGVVNGFFRPEIKVPRHFFSEKASFSIRSMREGIEEIRSLPSAQGAKKLANLVQHIKHLEPSDRGNSFQMLLDSTGPLKKGEDRKEVLEKIAVSFKFLKKDQRLDAFKGLLQNEGCNSMLLWNMVEIPADYGQSFFKNQFGEDYVAAFSLAAEKLGEHLMTLVAELGVYEEGPEKMACINAVLNASQTFDESSLSPWALQDYNRRLEDFKKIHAPDMEKN